MESMKNNCYMSQLSSLLTMLLKCKVKRLV